MRHFIVRMRFAARILWRSLLTIASRRSTVSESEDFSLNDSIAPGEDLSEPPLEDIEPPRIFNLQLEQRRQTLKKLTL